MSTGYVIMRDNKMEVIYELDKEKTNKMAIPRILKGLPIHGRDRQGKAEC